MNVHQIFALIGGLLFILALIPQLDARLAILGGILLSIALFLVK